MMKTKQVWVFVTGIAFLCAAFWFLNFRLATSNTQSEKNITTAGIGVEDSLPDAMQRREKINLALVGEGPLIAALKDSLMVEMNNARIGDIEWTQGIAPKYQSPVLVVKVGRPSLVWTPFFATSRFTVQAGYSSSGDTTLIEETPVTIDNRNGPNINMFGEYKISDRTWGLISRPAYHQSLADYLAQQIVAALKDLYRLSA